MEECEVKKTYGLSNNLSLCIFLKIFLIEIFLRFTIFHINLFDMTSNLHPIKKRCSSISRLLIVSIK